MKKLVFIIASVFVIMTLSNVFAESGTGWSYDESSKTLTISNNDGVDNWKNDENGVKELGIESVENIVIEDNVTELPDYAFENYNSLKKLSLSSGLTTVPYASFAHCTSLEEIIIPDSVTNIGDYTFNECRSAKNIKLGNGLKEIGFCAFSQPDSLETLIIPDNVTKIGTYAFCDAISLKILSIGSGVKDIGWYAFSSSKALDKVIFEGDLPSIDNSFYDTPEDKTIYVEDAYVAAYTEYFKNDSKMEIKTLNKGSILDIEKTFSVENVDTYTIYFNDGSTFDFTITNGEKGENGKDSLAPKIKINETTNEWEVSYDDGNTWESLGVVATGEDGKDGTDGKNGTNITIRGENGITPKLRINDTTNEWEVSYDNEKTWTSLGVVATGKDGTDGKDGVDGIDGVDGQDYTSMNITVYIIGGIAALSLIINIILIIVLKNKSVI